MDCYLHLVGIRYLSEAFWGSRIVIWGMKPTDGATIFAYLRTGETSGIDEWVKLRKKEENCNEIDGIWTKVSPMVTTTPKGTIVKCSEFCSNLFYNK